MKLQFSIQGENTLCKDMWENSAECSNDINYAMSIVLPEAA